MRSLSEDKVKQIIKKTGPKFLRHAFKNENTLTLAIEAFRKIKNKEEIKKKIKNVIFVTETPVNIFPGNAVMFSSKLNLNENLNLIDLNSGCTGFVDAIKIATNLDGATLIICSETYSKYFKDFNRSISTIFSDCASIFFYQNSFKIIKQSSGFEKNTHNYLIGYNKNELYMNGSKVYSFVTSKVVPNLENFIAKTSNHKISKIYIHQASRLVINTFKEKFKSYNIDFPSNLTKYGNTNASTIALLFEDDLRNKKLKKGDKIILCGFGVGLSFSIVLIEI